MNIKYFIFAFFTLCGLQLVSSCGDDDNAPDLSEAITVVRSDLIFDPVGRTGFVEVQTQGSFSVQLESDWCEASVNGNTINVTVSDNNTFEGRTALLVIRTDAAERRLAIQQRGMALGSLPISSRHVENAGERFSLYIRHDLPVNFTIDEDWLHAEMQGDSMIVTVDRNPNLYMRRGEIIFECGGFESPLAITQYDKKYILGAYYFAGTGQGGMTQGFRFNLREIDGKYYMNFYTSESWHDINIPIDFDESLCEITFHSATVIYENGSATRDVFYFFQSDGTVVTSSTATMKAHLYYNPFIGTHYATLEDGGTWPGEPLVGFIIYMTRSIVTTPIVQLLDPYIMWIGEDSTTV